MLKGPGERHRLRVLRSYEILDSEDESAFDDLTRLVAQILDVPIALISLIDEDRQWFKSRFGLEVRETPREVALCNTAIRDDCMLVVPDASADKRFATNPLVTGKPNIRFYAGMPLIAPEGTALGTLCAVDDHPRVLAPSQADALEILARQVMAQLELRRLTRRTMRDQVERLEMEIKLQESQKSDGLAVLAGGIAHDFNNLLAGILGNANLAAMEVDRGTSLAEAIENIETISMRASDLTRQMLAYSGVGSQEAKGMDLSRLVDEMGHLLAVAIPPNVDLSFDLGNDPLACDGDPTQIRRVVMNLLLNGSDAIGEDQGAITVRTGKEHLSQARIDDTLLPELARPGEFIFVEVVDTGCGMAPEIRARIFEPFFTTKLEGRGLGLAAVLGIVRAHAGTIAVQSVEGQGTTIRVLFPVSQSSSVPREEGPSLAAGDGELVLVVDDEEHVRTVLRGLLERLGFSVTTAKDGREAVAALVAERDAIAVVLMDVTMPEMDGVEAFHRMRDINPVIPIVLMSGHNEYEIKGLLTPGNRTGFLQKPFIADDLRAKIREALGSAGSQRGPGGGHGARLEAPGSVGGRADGPGAREAR